MKKNYSKYYLYSAVFGLLFIGGIAYYYLFASLSKEAQTIYIYIDNDDTPDSVFNRLQPIATTNGLTGFKVLARHFRYDKSLRTGRYAIRKGEGALVTFRHIKNGLQTPISITIPEARTMDRLAVLLSKKLMLDSATIAQALYDSAFCKSMGYDTATIAAMFIPNTYDVYWNVGIEQLMERMKKEHDTFWNTERLQKAQTIKLTPNEVATLASIIDEETANNNEKPMIAGMYINRINTGMPLQADPTIKFALKQFELKRIYNNLLKTNSPYNTYIHEGLPPGPIKIASIKGIDAVLNHVEHDYLYMCAKEDFSGTHNFARTYHEHLQNAARYTKALNEHGIK